jgi:uroporphyrinogen decarboxylase
MTKRERVLAAIRHQEPDRVPIDLGATPSSGISAIAYANLIKHLGLTNSKTRIYDVCQQVAQPEDAVLENFGIDVVDIGRTFNTGSSDWYGITLSNGELAEYPSWFHPKKEADGSYTAFGDGNKAIGRMPQGATFFDQINFPYVDGYPADYSNLGKDMGMVSWQAFAHSPWDHGEDGDFWETLRKRAMKLREETDYALMVVAGCNLFEWGTFLRRIDNFLMDLVMDEKNVEKLLDALMELHLQTLEKVCESVGDVVDILRFGDDFGTDAGPFMQPVIYRKMFKPRETILCDYVKKNSSMHTFLHSCGSISEFIPDFIEAGYDIINPVQTNARGMDPKELKNDFGEDITFWGGGVDTRSVLNNATPKQVKEQVKRRLEIFCPDGGYVFNTIHNIMPDVPPENVIAMFDAVREFHL